MRGALAGKRSRCTSSPLADKVCNNSSNGRADNGFENPVDDDNVGAESEESEDEDGVAKNGVDDEAALAFVAAERAVEVTLPL